jgi:hypothetical protein
MCIELTHAHFFRIWAHHAPLRTELVAAQPFDERTVDKLLSTYFLTLLKNTWLEHWVMGVYSKVVALPPSLSELRADLHKLYPEKMSSHLSVAPSAHHVFSSASNSYGIAYRVLILHVTS